MEIELQSARYHHHHQHHQHHQHEAVKSETEVEEGNGSETELDEGGDKDDEDEDEDITIDEDDEGSHDDHIHDHSIRERNLMKVRETRVGLWKGYLRLSKVSLSILSPGFVPASLSSRASRFPFSGIVLPPLHSVGSIANNTFLSFISSCAIISYRLAWDDNYIQPDGFRDYIGAVTSYASEYQEVHLGRVRQGRGRSQRPPRRRRIGNANGA
jgi:hypothetical protein